MLRLGEIGLAHAIHPHLSADPETVTLLERLDDGPRPVRPDEPRWRLRLAVLARRLPPDELYEWFGRLRLRRRDGDEIADAVVVSGRSYRPSSTSTSRPRHAPDRTARPGGALLALALAEPGAAGWLERYFEELRDVRLEISGGDLAALGLEDRPESVRCSVSFCGAS